MRHAEDLRDRLSRVDAADAGSVPARIHRRPAAASEAASPPWGAAAAAAARTAEAEHNRRMKSMAVLMSPPAQDAGPAPVSYPSTAHVFSPEAGGVSMLSPAPDFHAEHPSVPRFHPEPSLPFTPLSASPAPSPPGSPYGGGAPHLPGGQPCVSEVFIVEWSPHTDPQMLEVQRGGAGGVACAVLHLNGVRKAVVRADTLKEVTAGSAMWFTLKCINGEAYKVRPRFAHDYTMLAESLSAVQSASQVQELKATRPPSDGVMAKPIARVAPARFSGCRRPVVLLLAAFLACLATFIASAAFLNRVPATAQEALDAAAAAARLAADAVRGNPHVASLTSAFGA